MELNDTVIEVEPSVVVGIEPGTAHRLVSREGVRTIVFGVTSTTTPARRSCQRSLHVCSRERERPDERAHAKARRRKEMQNSVLSSLRLCAFA